MAIFRKVHTEFWTDSKVIEEMTPEDKFFYLYILTNPSTSQIGIYEITKKQMSFETGYTIESINALMDRFENHHRLIKYNKETRELCIFNWGRFNLDNHSKPLLDCIKSQLPKVKDKSLLLHVVESIPKDQIRDLFLNEYELSTDSTGRGTSRGEEQEQEEEQEEEQEQQQEEKTQIEKVVCVLDKKILFEEGKKILEIAGNDIGLIKEKYEIAKVSEYKNLIGFMVKAIKEDWQMPKKQAKSKSNKITKFHNFESRTGKYTPEELEKIVLKR